MTLEDDSIYIIPRVDFCYSSSLIFRFLRIFWSTNCISCVYYFETYRKKKDKNILVYLNFVVYEKSQILSQMNF